MGYQVIKQPGDGLYAIFSSYTDTWAVYDADRQEVFDFFAERAKESADRDTLHILTAIEEDPRKAYHQFAMTFEEANAKSVEHDGEDLSGLIGTEEEAADNQAG